MNARASPAKQFFRTALLATFIVLASCGPDDSNDPDLGASATECNEILDQGIGLVFAQGWSVDMLNQLTVDFAISDLASGEHISNLDVFEVGDKFYRLSFPPETYGRAITEFVRFLSSESSVAVAEGEPMVVNLFRVEREDNPEAFGIVASYIPDNALLADVLEIITNQGNTYRHNLDTENGEYVAERATPKLVAAFLDEWGFEYCE